MGSIRDTSSFAKEMAQAWKNEQFSGAEVYGVMGRHIVVNALAPKFQLVICKGTQKAIDMITQDHMARLSTIINITASAKALDRTTRNGSLVVKNYIQLKRTSTLGQF